MTQKISNLIDSLRDVAYDNILTTVDNYHHVACIVSQGRIVPGSVRANSERSVFKTPDGRKSYAPSMHAEINSLSCLRRFLRG